MVPLLCLLLKPGFWDGKTKAQFWDDGRFLSVKTVEGPLEYLKLHPSVSLYGIFDLKEEQ